MKEVIIFKNDRTGDLFVSLKAINRIINKHNKQNISIFLSNLNHKFNFIFPNLDKKIISLNLNILEKIKIFFYLLTHKIDTIYILSPKNFYYYLPLFFRRIKFYAITIKSKKSRPYNFLLKYLFRYVVIDRLQIKKRISSYILQENLIEEKGNKNYLQAKSNPSHEFILPDKFVLFHYKKNLFQYLLKWSLDDIYNFLNFLKSKYENVLFTSEINNNLLNDKFENKFNTFDFILNKKKVVNNKKIFFLKDVDGKNLFDVVQKSSKIVCPEGIMTHMGYYLKKPILALIHFNLYSKEDFKNQIISCKEWFPPSNYQYSVLKKSYSESIKKLNKRL